MNHYDCFTAKTGTVLFEARQTEKIVAGHNMNYLSNYLKATEHHFHGNQQFIVKSEYWKFFQLLLNFWHQTNGVSITAYTFGS